MTLIKWNPSVGKEKQHQLLPSVDSLFGSLLNNDPKRLCRLCANG